VRSGSLITARLGLEAGREIFAVPGSPLDARCRGCNDLIRQGAHLTESVEDVLAHLPNAPAGGPSFPFRSDSGYMPKSANPAPAGRGLTGDEAQVVDLLGPAPVVVDDVLRRCHLSTPVVQAILLDLELAGCMEMLPGNRVALTGKG
jgi:DNA processing protein